MTATDYTDAAKTLAKMIRIMRRTEQWGLWTEAQTFADREEGPVAALAMALDELFTIARKWSTNGDCVPFGAFEDRRAEIAALEAVGLIRTEQIDDGWRIVACDDDRLFRPIRVAA